MRSSYIDLLNRLLSLPPSQKTMTLETTEKLDAAFGYPSRAYPIIHVAGTNGKGSVVTKLARTLQLAGYRVGMYTSPHIASFRERIQINAEPISEEAIRNILLKGFALCQHHNLTPSFFELTTCAAFQHFAEERVDVAVIEVGLGGRLDSTNIVTPVVSVITSISLDHTSVLGETRESIAREKAGIIKQGVPVVVGPRADLAPIECIARERNASYNAVNGFFDTFDAENSAVAKTALGLLSQRFPSPEAAIESGLRALPPCRMEFHAIGNGIILDVAHNPDGIMWLRKSLGDRYPKRNFRYVCGFSKEKDVSECLRLLGANESPLHFVAANHARAMPLETLLAAATHVLGTATQYQGHQTVAEGVHAALEAAKKRQELLVICGSFFLMSEARNALGIPQIADPFDLNEATPILGKNSLGF